VGVLWVIGVFSRKGLWDPGLFLLLCFLAISRLTAACSLPWLSVAYKEHQSLKAVGPADLG
jgi:hypothetical protein